MGYIETGMKTENFLMNVSLLMEKMELKNFMKMEKSDISPNIKTIKDTVSINHGRMETYLETNFKNDVYDGFSRYLTISGLITVKKLVI